MAEDVFTQPEVPVVEPTAPQEASLQDGSNPPKLSVTAFAAKIKTKYPDYKDIDDKELVTRMLNKYPTYASQIDLGEVKKKPSTQGSVNTLQPSNIGGQNDPNFLNLTNNEQQSYAPVINPVETQRLEASDALYRQEQADKKTALSNSLKKIRNQLPVESQALWDKGLDITANREPDRLSAPTKEELAHNEFMDTTGGKILGATAYLGSKATKGTLQIAKGVAHLADLSQNPMRAATGQNNEVIDQTFNKLDEAANYGLTKSDLNNIEEGEGMGKHALAGLGMMAEFAPSIAIGKATSAPKAIFYLQGLGQGKDLADNLSKQNKNLNPLAKEALIQGSGFVNMILSDLGDNLYGKLPSVARGKIATGIAADAIKEGAGKDLTYEGFKQLLDKGAKTFVEKFEKAPVEILNKYNHTAATLGGLNVANFAVHKGVDAINDQPVFNESLGDLAEGINKTLTQEAPLFTALGAVPDLTKLTPYSSYKNDVVESLVNNPSRENVDAIKQQVAEHGSERGWSQEEMAGSLQHVEQIAQASTKIPNTIKPEKRADAIGLIIDRDGMAKRLAQVQESKKQLDPAIADIPTAQEQYLTDKIEQANDKLRSIVTGKPVTYSRDAETGKTVKKQDGKEEPIDESRYEMERIERELKSEETEPVTTETPTENEQTVQPEVNEINPSVPVEQPTVEARVQETDSKIPDAKVEERQTVSNADAPKLSELTNNIPEIGKEGISIEEPFKKDNRGHFTNEPLDNGTETIVSRDKDGKVNGILEVSYNGKDGVQKEPVSVKVVVDENSRRQGIATKLFKHAQDNGIDVDSVRGKETTEVGQALYEANKATKQNAIRKKAIDAITNGVLIPENIKDGEVAARFDFGMDVRDRKKGLSDIKKGEYDTAPAKKIIEKVMEWEAKGEYPIIEGKGGSTVRRKAATSDEIQKEIDVEKEKVKSENTVTKKEIVEPPKAGDPLRTFAAKVREGKISKLGGFKSGSLFDTAWDGSLEVVATAIEGGAKLADAIESGLKHIRSTQWYKDLQDKKAFDDAYVPHMEKEYAKEQETSPKSETESKVESSNDLKSLAIDIPNGGEVKKYLSGETIERHEGDDLRNDQSYIRQELNPALEHGVKIIEQAKAEFGKDYVPKTLQFIEENGTVESKALMYVSLENELAARKLAEPENSLAISKLQDLVREKSQAYLRSNAIAINMGRLRKFAEVGYDINKVTDNFFSRAEREKKAKVEKSIQSTPDEINKQAEIKEADVKDEGDFDIKPKARKKIFGLNETQKKERDALAKEFRGQFNDVTRIATLLVNKKFLKYAKLEFLDTAGDFESFAHKMIDNVGSGIKEHLPELYKKFGGEDEVKLKVKAKSERTPEEKLSDAKDLVKNRIDDLFEQIQSKKRELKTREVDIEADAELKALQAEEAALRRVRDKELPLDRKPVTDEQKAKSQITRLTDEIENIDKQIKQGEKDAIEEKNDPINDERVNKLKAEKNARLQILEAIDPNPKETVKKALIENGFGREITVTTKNGKEQRQIIDWKKLAGEEGSVVKIQEHVEEYLRKNGYSEGDILRMQDAFVKEYNDLRASVIEKSLNELQNRNKEVPAKDIKTSAKRLAELYNYGLFDKQPDTYDYLMNKALGLGDIGQEGFFKAKILAKSLSDLFRSTDENGNVINQSNLKHAESVINKKIENLLSDVAFKQASTPYKLATIAKEYVGLAQRSMLVSVSQLLENTSSGYIARAFNKIGFSLDNVDTKALRNSRTKLANNIFKDINLNAALDYGDVNSPFLNKSRTMELINNASDSKVYHALSTALLGRSFLEGADSMHKVALTEKFFTYNLIKVLRKKGMEKQEAINYVSEQLTGQSFKDALVTSKEIIDKINADAGKKIIPDNNESIHRFANDIVREALIGGNKLSLKEVEASFGAAYTAAGFELGHEANNLTSMMVSGLSEKIQGKLNKAVKEKDWSAATAYTGASTIATNVMNPFVGGGSNWVFLGLQKAGIPTLSTLYFNMKARRGIDVASEAGQKTLERDLTNQLLAKNANTRLVLGATLSLAAVALAKSTNADEDLNKWLKKNKWAKKYFNKISPPALSLLLAMKNKEVGHYVATLLNVKDNAAFDEGKKVITAVQNASKGTTGGRKKALGAAGDLIGSRLSTPLIPWRLIRDTEDITRGLMGLPPIKKDFQTSGFWNGYFKGGLVEYMDARPKKD